jgi:hypothetical protein
VQLLEEEGVSFRDRDDALAQRLRHVARRCQPGDELCGLLRGQGPKLDRLRRASPAGPFLEEARAGEADDEDGRVRDPALQILDEVEHARLGPMHVLEHDNERPLAPECLEQQPGGPEHLSGRACAVRLAGQLGKSGRDELRVLVAGQERGDDRARPVRRNLPDDLGQRQVGRALTVGEAPSHDEPRFVAERRGELQREAALADAGLAEDREDPAPILGASLLEGLLEPFELLPATHEPRATGAPGVR